MKKLFVIGWLVVLFVGTVPILWAQEENLSANRAWGIGVRFLPSALMPIVPWSTDPALGSALALRIWVNELLGLEAGGLVSNFSDTWNQNASTLLSGGLLFKFSDNSKLDLYLVGRGISLRSVSKGMCCVILKPRPEPQPQNIIVPPPWPWPGFESRSSTLAVEAASGIEWSLSPQVALNFEFGLIYAQTVTTHVPPPPPPPPPEEPIPLQKPETFVSSSLGLMLHVGVYFYFERK